MECLVKSQRNPDAQYKTTISLLSFGANSAALDSFMIRKEKKTPSLTAFCLASPLASGAVQTSAGLFKLNIKVGHKE